MRNRTTLLRVCTGCKQHDDARNLVKYSTRSYAHGECLLKSKGKKAFDILSDYQIERLPLKVSREVMSDMGLLDDYDRALKTAQDREPPSFDLLDFPTCYQCGDPMPEGCENDTVCPKCRQSPEEFLRRQLVIGAEAMPAATRHTKPCADCPWARKALPGWLGDLTAEDWLEHAHGETRLECHTLRGQQCAGGAIYRANVAKRPRDRELLNLPRDTGRVFANRDEFLAHHKAARPTPRTSRRPRDRRE